MQLGELQGQLERFQNRGASLVAISIDEIGASRSIIKRLGITFDIASDHDQKIMQAFGVQNPDTKELALHAVYIVDKERKAFYRKIASRRPRSQELLDAIDHHYNNKPVDDTRLIEADWQFAYPQNSFQTLIELSAVDVLPSSLSISELQPIIELLQAGQTDDALVAFRHYTKQHIEQVPQADLLAAAAWLTKHALAIDPEASITGKALNTNLIRSRRTKDTASNSENISTEKEIEVLRSVVRRNQRKWKLGYAKSLLRSYRQLVLVSEQD